jgi:hypothetical protein
MTKITPKMDMLYKGDFVLYGTIWKIKLYYISQWSELNE